MTEQVTLCACGCGKIPPIATETRPKRGWVKGERLKYWPHHSKNRWPVETEGGKQCRSCKEVKALTEFWVNRKNRDGLQVTCKDCGKLASYGYRNTEGGKVRFIVARHKGHLKRYKITDADFSEMLLRQNGLCAICKQPETELRLGTPKRLAIDHCHATGKIRGLLCCACNHAIGKLKDDPALLRRAAEYLEAASI